MDKYFHQILYWICGYLSMQSLYSIRLGERGSRGTLSITRGLIFSHLRKQLWLLLKDKIAVKHHSPNSRLAFRCVDLNGINPELFWMLHANDKVPIDEMLVSEEKRLHEDVLNTLYTNVSKVQGKTSFVVKVIVVYICICLIFVYKLPAKYLQWQLELGTILCYIQSVCTFIWISVVYQLCLALW